MRPSYALRISSAVMLAAALVAAWSVPIAAESQCVASFREIKFPDGSARVKNYVCKTEGAAKPEIQVEFDRLSEAAAASLIMGESYPDMERAFGKVRVVNNAVAQEVRNIFDRFGTKVTSSECTAFRVASASGGSGHKSEPACETERTLWYLSYPDDEGWTTLHLPLASDLQYLLTNTDWPPGFSFYYGPADDCWDFSPIACVLLWRAVRPSDLADYDKKLADYDRTLGLEPFEPQPDAESDNVDSWEDWRKRYFALVSYLTADGWPEDFLFVTGTLAACGGIDFELHVRQMILDVAVIKNISTEPLSIEALLGRERQENALRQAGSSAGGGTSDRIALPDGEIEPGEVVAVPLAISFVTVQSLESQFETPEESAKTFNRIQSAAPGTLFEMKSEDYEAAIVIKKLRESFGAPTQPKAAVYVYGPEIALTGLVINGKPLIFDQASRNFLQLASIAEGGSCPYLYSWEDNLGTWVHHGKVIHVANGQENEATETRSFTGFRSKFRLAEEEFEVSYIDHVKLDVELRDGVFLRLRPDFEALAAKDGRYAIIKAGDRIEFSFALPPNVDSEDVTQSTLAVTGYYRRYSDLLLARQ